MTIPRRLHYVWVGPKPLPAKVRDLVEGWRRLNPTYEILFWNEENIDFSYRFVQTAYGMRAWNRVSDFVRMWALAKFGGIYLDTDVELRRSFDDLLGDPCFLGFQLEAEHPDWINGAVLGSVPGHWLVKSLLRHFICNMGGWEELGSYYGPGLITTKLRRAGLRRYADEPQYVRDVRLYPRRYFYPYAWTESFSETCVTPDTYAIHHWEDSWRKSRRFGDRLERALLRNFAWAVPSLACRAQLDSVRRQHRIGDLAPPPLVTPPSAVSPPAVTPLTVTPAAATSPVVTPIFERSA